MKEGVSNLYARTVFFVSDTGRATQFYTERLGFSLDWDSNDGVCQVSLLGFELILNQVGDRTRSRAGHGRLFIGLDEEQAEPFRAHLASKAIRPRRAEWGRPTLVVSDPDGNELFFWLPHDDFTGVLLSSEAAGGAVNHPTLARRIDAVSRLHGEFRLRSGTVSNEYFDKYRFESEPELLTAIADGLAVLVPPGIDALAGLELGGVPVATALSIRTGLRAVFVRKQAKSYGTCRLAEGREIAGLRLLVVEDVVTSGGQILESCDELRRAGAIVEDVVCVIDRQAGGAEALATAGLKLWPLLTKEDLDSPRQ